MQPHNKRRIRFVLKCFLLLLVVAVLAGIAYEQLGRRRDRERFPQVGRSVDIGGRPRQPASVVDSNSPLRISATGSPSGAGTIPVASIRASQGRAPGFTADQAATLHGLGLPTKSFVAAASCNAFEKCAAQAHAVGNLGDRPLIVLTAGRAFTVGEPEEDKELAAFHEIWVHQLQPQLVRLSTRGHQVIVENRGHGIGWEAPDAVVKSVRDVVALTAPR